MARGEGPGQRAHQVEQELTGVTVVSRRTEALAKEQGATHTFALVTGKYSAIAFDRLGHTLVS